MITYQFINALSDAAPQSHLIASATCTHLPETALVAEMRESASIADTRFGCAPFARITLLPDALWQDSLTEGLLAALRPLLASPVSPELILDVTDIDDVVLAQVLRFLFNQAHRLSDLQLKKTCDSVRLERITALCLPEQQDRLAAIFRQQQAIAQGMVAARRLADIPSDRCHAAVCGGRGAKALCRLSCPAV
ncbi:leucyl aminopeptidase [Enterobacter asburiae]|uniref:Leucyl aminopeptidase n=1 Tax=Enterobacter asburiae TaxID=61645 RepID=A0A376FN44_ENTAS|nr:leucyl aminopeptidase [Enterobacter asburiae]